MSESTKFLNQHLPQYFTNSFSQIPPSTDLDLGIMRRQGDFLRMIAQLFAYQQSPLAVQQFILNTFIVQDNDIVISCDLGQQDKKLTHFLMQRFGSINSLMVSLLTQLVYLDCRVRASQGFHRSQERISDGSAQIISIFQRLRFQCEIYNQFTEKDGEECDNGSIVKKIVDKWVEIWDIQQKTWQILLDIIEDQCANLEDDTKEYIRLKSNYTSIRDESLRKSLSEPQKKSSNTVQKSESCPPTAYQIISEGLLQKKYKSQQCKSVRLAPRSTNHTETLKRIEEYAKLRKSKAIAKAPRTVHQTRKGAFVNKLFESFSMNSLQKQEQSTQNSIDFTHSTSFNVNPVKLDIHYQECDEDQNCLVSSTPKPARSKPVFDKTISKRLQFS